MAVIDTLVAHGPIRVLVAAGPGGVLVRQRLRADDRIRVVRSPRHASVLVVCGRVPDEDADALARVHDQVPRPRGVVAVDVDGLPAALAGARRVRGDDTVADVVAATGRSVLVGEVDSDDLGPAENPTEWRGVGPHGQGGEGMMGGTPYGRSMPMTSPGRDGLALDRLPLTLGPWLAGLPAGVSLEVGLQGDVLEEVTVTCPAAGEDAPRSVGVAELERWRARTLLGWLADLAALAGLEAEARRCSRLALDPTARGIASVRRRLDRRWSLRAATDGVGGVSVGDATGVGLGWLARSRGIAHDRRTGDPAYDGLDLPPVTDRGPDVTARWRTWLEEAATAVALADAADDRRTDRPELPWGSGDGTPAERAEARGQLASQLLRGAELGRAMVTLASLPGAADATLPARREVTA